MSRRNSFIAVHGWNEACLRNKILGLRDDDGLPFYYFQGTSYSPETINKNINKNTPGGATWCPDKNETKDSFLEVDLGKHYLLCGVSTQGDNYTNGFTKSYKIKLSSNRIKWKFYQNNGIDKVFEGNDNSTTTVYHSLNSTESARFVRFYPIIYETNACIRVELYGEEIKKERCEKTVVDANAPDVVISSFPRIPASKYLAILDGTESWCWTSNFTKPYLKVDFEAYSVICALNVTLNGMVKISYGNESLNKSQNINGSQLYTPKEKILTTFLQLKPMSPTGNFSCLSVKIYGYLNEELVNEDIGFQYGKSAIFPDESLATSLDQFDKDYANPRDGRLYKPWKFWCPLDSFEASYLELILVEKYYIFAVSVQGQPRTSSNNFMMNLLISYSDNYSSWKKYNATFLVSSNNIIEKHILVQPIKARIVRIDLAADYNGKHTCIKVELHGIIVEESSGYCRKPHPLGLSSQVAASIPDISITASSQLYSIFAPRNARLRDSKIWCAKRISNQTLSVDLGKLVSISGVATQGSRRGKTTEFRIRYSYDGRIWYGYPNNASPQIFSGNSASKDDNAIFANWLNDSITTRHIQLEIRKYYKYPCLRLELYGCKKASLVLPAVPGKPSIGNIKSKSAVITWKAADDYLERRLERYVILVSSGSYTMKINVTTGIERKNLTYHLSYLTEYTSYHVSIAAESAIAISNFTEKVTFLTLLAPKIVRLTASSNTTNGETYLKCDVLGNPFPDVWWTKNGSYLNDDNNIRFENQNRTLVIIAAQPSDGGMYYCHARNKLSYVNGSFQLDFIFLPRIFYLQKGPIQLYNWQKNLRVACAGSGYPNVRVTWKRNGSEILNSINSTLDTRVYQIKYKIEDTVAVSLLHFKEVYCHDAGNYTCESAIDGHDHVDRKYIQLNCSSDFNQSTLITPLPSSTITPLTSSSGMSPTLTPVVSTSIAPISTIKTHSVFITPTPTSSYYSLVASSVSAVPLPANLYVTPINPAVVEKSSIVLSCNCGCSIRPHWFKNNQSIPYNGTESSYTLLANGSLHINVSRDTAGNYSCEIRTHSWGVISEEVKLKVWYLDDCYVTGDQHIYEGQNISLTCHGNGDPYPIFTWYLDGQKLKISYRIRIQRNQLNILNATTNDGGKYACVVSNQAGQVSDGVDVTVRDIPSIRILANRPKYVVKGTVVRFTCQWTNLSHIRLISKMELVKDGISFYQWWRLWLASYAFTASLNQAGRYQCKGTIGAASQYSSPFFLVVGIPSGPIVLNEKSETSTTGIKLSWKPISKKFWNGEQVTFEVHVSSMDNTWKKSYKVKTTNAVISGLRPATAYIVNITGRTVFGPFQNVTIAVMQTKENKNTVRFQLRIRLENYEFSNDLMDATSSQYNNLKYKLEQSLRDIFEKSAIKFHYIGSSVSGFEEGSVVVIVVVSLDSQFKSSPSILVQELNKVNTIAEYRFDKSYTSQKDFDECQDADSNTCHEYAHCENDVGTYICNCFEGFFGDGEECQGPPQIISKSPANITQLVERNVTLVCTVIADPNPTISWKHTDLDGKITEVKRTNDKFDGNYTIYNARIEDSGKYSCNASNPLGYEFYTAVITIKPEIVNISVEIKLSNKTFKEELNNKSSPAFQELKNDVYVELYKFFNNTPGFEDIEILGFANGSVKVIFRVIVKVLKPSKETNDVVAVKIGRKINKQLKTGRIGNIQVVPEAIKLRVPPPPPANVTYSDVKETRVHIRWDPPELHQMFSIKRYYITYLKHGEKIWSNNTINGDQTTNFQVDNLESDTFYTLLIIAENKYGLGKESSRMEIKTMKVEVVSPWYYIGPIIGVACVVLLVIIIYLVRRVLFSRGWKLVKDRNTNTDKKEEKTSFQMLEKKTKNENTYTNVAFSHTPETSGWKEIPRTSIETSHETLIPGEFGITVVQGTFLCPLEKTKGACSVKMLKENTTADDRRDLMNELATISAISYHENIVKLIGACTSEEGPVLLVFDFCSRGTLESNLQESEKNRQLCMNKTKISLTNEIAKGMRHLADSRIVHRDLAARNILLTEDYTPKIFNFGLSRDIYERSSYHKLSPGNLPTRWLAIESLTDGSYTTKSDVWSFAVLMWEIETGGSIPYQEFVLTELVNQISGGYRLPKPDETSNDMYKLMLQCWDANPENRPTFHEIIDIMMMYTGKDKYYLH